MSSAIGLYCTAACHHHSLVRRDGCEIPRFPALATMSMEVRMCFIITRSAQQNSQRRAEMWAIVAPHEGQVYAALAARRVFPRHTLLSDKAFLQSSKSSKCPMPVRLLSRPLARRLLQIVARHRRGPHFLRLEIRKIHCSQRFGRVGMQCSPPLKQCG
jgi:hypothetical protein